MTGAFDDGFDSGFDIGSTGAPPSLTALLIEPALTCTVTLAQLQATISLDPGSGDDGMALFIGCDQTLKVNGLQDAASEAYINDATITATMTDSEGDEVDGQSWPLTLDYVADSDGDYQGLLEDGRVMAEGQLYRIEVSIDAGGDLIDRRRWHDVARYRGPSD